jgi:hypothetical protein
LCLSDSTSSREIRAYISSLPLDITKTSLPYIRRQSADAHSL